MSHNLTKEQLLLLQNNLSFNHYEKFMSMFKKAEILPIDVEEFIDKIIQLMKDHEYWGAISGWGPKRFYKRITKHKVNIILSFGNFKGKSSEEFISWMNRSSYHDMLSGFSDEDMLKVENDDDNDDDDDDNDDNDDDYDNKEFQQVPLTTRWENDNSGW